MRASSDANLLDGNPFALVRGGAHRVSRARRGLPRRRMTSCLMLACPGKRPSLCAPTCGGGTESGSMSAPTSVARQGSKGSSLNLGRLRPPSFSNSLYNYKRVIATTRIARGLCAIRLSWMVAPGCRLELSRSLCGVAPAAVIQRLKDCDESRTIEKKAPQHWIVSSFVHSILLQGSRTHIPNNCPRTPYLSTRKSNFDRAKNQKDNQRFFHYFLSSLTHGFRVGQGIGTKTAVFDKAR